MREPLVRYLQARTDVDLAPISTEELADRVVQFTGGGPPSPVSRIAIALSRVDSDLWSEEGLTEEEAEDAFLEWVEEQDERQDGYNPDQPRAENGQWGEGGFSPKPKAEKEPAAAAAPKSPAHVAHAKAARESAKQAVLHAKAARAALKKDPTNEKLIAASKAADNLAKAARSSARKAEKATSEKEAQKHAEAAAAKAKEAEGHAKPAPAKVVAPKPADKKELAADAKKVSDAAHDLTKVAHAAEAAHHDATFEDSDGEKHINPQLEQKAFAAHKAAGAAHAQAAVAEKEAGFIGTAAKHEQMAAYHQKAVDRMKSGGASDALGLKQVAKDASTWVESASPEHPDLDKLHNEAAAAHDKAYTALKSIGDHEGAKQAEKAYDYHKGEAHKAQTKKLQAASKKAHEAPVSNEAGAGTTTSAGKQLTHEDQKQMFQTLLPKLSEKEKASCLHYSTSHGCGEINGMLRGNKPASGAKKAELEAHAQEIDAAIKKAPLDQKVLLFRGINSFKAAAEIKAKGVGETFDDPGYASSSVSKDSAKGFASAGIILHVTAPKGAHAAAIPSHHSSEKELLLPRGSTFRISHIEQSGHHQIYHVTLIPKG